MKKHLFNLVLLTVVALTIAGCSCKRNFDKDYAGPLICPTDNFAVTTALTVTSQNGSNPVDFTSSTAGVLIAAQFNEVVTWTVKIKGLTSLAVNTYTGNSNQVSLTWTGLCDSAPFFVGETVTVDLYVACKTEAVQPTVSIAITKPTFLQLPGFMSNFNYGHINPAAASTPSLERPSINGNAGGNNPANNLPWSLYVVNPGDSGAITPSPEGGSYFNIHSADESLFAGPVWYYGGFEMTPNNATLLSPLPGLNADPSTVYLNFYANSNGVPNSQIQVAVVEHYGSATVKKTRSTTVNETWVGWKMNSIRLSDIGILDPRKICNIQLGLGAYLNKDVTAEANMDMVIFTNDAPLFPAE
ncbi:MAG: hypothetical protein JWM14_2799 [Chitinophagaceae bacterium]|nr:hypothetical protein [Chitinophagaceae bacterium]